QWRVPLLEANTSYYWRVAGLNVAGTGIFSSSRVFTTGETLGTQNDPQSPGVTAIQSIHPNPFKGSATIQLSLKDPGLPFELGIYNLKGQRVRLLHQGKSTTRQTSFIWDGKDGNGMRVSSGIYLCKLSSGGHVALKKLALLGH
ncbi:MAG TPA: FlgD immunoglobulin-like domain containing protein, partial [Candidatus Cloacimonadota bacterium]|nr:FlgD immunoglobulin-like domain containing protein [Candidatus Cloacimonadota bacterium]